VPAHAVLRHRCRIRIVSPCRAATLSFRSGRSSAASAAFHYKPFCACHIDAVLHRRFGLRVPDLMVRACESPGAQSGREPDPVARGEKAAK
jgi:hypothetical protein